MNEKQETYKNRCLEICQQNEQKLRQYKNETITKSSQHLEQEETNIQEKLQSCSNNLLIQSQNLLNKIQTHYKIDSLLWNIYTEITKEILAQNKMIQHLPLPDIHHDPTLQKNILECITKELQKKGVNPYRVTIRKKEEKKDNPPLYQVKNPIPCIYGVPSLTRRKHIKIIINENNFLKLPQSHQIAICACIATEVSQEFSFIPGIIAGLEPLIQTNSFLHSPQFMALQNMYAKKLPIFTTCLNDPYNVSSLLQLIPEYYYNDFTIEDYKLIDDITLYWNMLKWITQLKKIISFETCFEKQTTFKITGKNNKS
jgi:hypothetical protein